MDDLLCAVVLPIGDATSIRPEFLDRISFQTTPPWDVKNGSAYIVPQILRLPRRAPVIPLNGSISSTDASELRKLCFNFATQMVADRTSDEVKLLVESFLAYDRAGKSKRAGSSTSVDGPVTHDDNGDAEHDNNDDDVYGDNTGSIDDQFAEDDEEDFAQSPTSRVGLNPLALPFEPSSVASSDYVSFDAFSVASLGLESSYATSSAASTDDEDSDPRIIQNQVHKRELCARRSTGPVAATGKENKPP
ncbi:hypothetical protein AURDEDRAFT_167734 [Auricularia subglabra TFB-10046 SS5]|nr:hypothetical protein AURDEDRAFT_167734 [Auricularia subglabra TFB-10046 SS5]